MKYSSIYQERIGCNDAEMVFAYFMNTLKASITKWDYFVNWTKVFVISVISEIYPMGYTDNRLANIAAQPVSQCTTYYAAILRAVI